MSMKNLQATKLPAHSVSLLSDEWINTNVNTTVDSFISSDSAID